MFLTLCLNLFQERFSAKFKGLIGDLENNGCQYRNGLTVGEAFWRRKHSREIREMFWEAEYSQGD